MIMQNQKGQYSGQQGQNKTNPSQDVSRAESNKREGSNFQSGQSNTKGENIREPYSDIESKRVPNR
jgi:hypothetical protein